MVLANSVRRETIDKRMHFADGLRGVAALWVVLFHISEGHHIDGLRAWLPHLVDTALFDWGHGGVGIFFVLSGFVMALTVERAMMDGAGAGRFVLRRLVRLCPPYWLAIVVSTALLATKGTPVHEGQLIANVFFLQGVLGYDNINIVFWTLCIEIQFYLAFAVMTWVSDLISPLDGTTGRGIPRIVIALLSIAWPLGLVSSPIWHGGFLPFWAYFMAGVVAWEANRGNSTTRLFGLTFSLMLLVMGLARADLFSGVAGLTGIALIASGFNGGMQSWLSGRAVQFLGRVSYSLYLFHNTVTGIVFRVISKITSRHSIFVEATGSAIALAACMGIAWAMWFTVERTSIGWGRRLSNRASDAAPVSLAA